MPDDILACPHCDAAECACDDFLASDMTEERTIGVTWRAMPDESTPIPANVVRVADGMAGVMTAGYWYVGAFMVGARMADGTTDAGYAERFRLAAPAWHCPTCGDTAEWCSHASGDGGHA